MNAEEINKLVAEHIMGMPWKKPGHGSCCTCQTCGHNHDECQCFYVYEEHSDEKFYDTPEDTWKIVDEMAKKGFDLELEYDSHNGIVEVRFFGKDMAYGIYEHTIPAMAICMAALKALGVNLELEEK